MSEKTLSPKEKLEELYIIYYNSFELFKKSAPKKDVNIQHIKDIYNQLRDSQKFFLQNIVELSLLFVKPYEKCNTKIIEVIIENYKKILDNKLVDSYLLQEMSKILIGYLVQYFQDSDIDFKVYAKILKICYLIYANDDLFIHNEHLKYILKICLHIYLSTKNNDKYQGLSQDTVSLILKKMLSRFTFINYETSSNSNNNNYFNLNNNSNNISTISNVNNNQNPNAELERKKGIINNLQLNEFNFINKKYIDFMIDLIEINQTLNNDDKNNSNNSNNGYNLIDKYIEIIQDIHNNQDNYNKNYLLKTELEKLKLNTLNINLHNQDDNKDYHIGKYGWCILCRKTANYFSSNIQFPICEKNSKCEIEFYYHLANVYSRADFLYTFGYLIVTTTVEASKEAITNIPELNLQSRLFCLEIMKEMIEKYSKYFYDDIDVIYIIKVLFKDSLLKNTLSKNIKIFQISLELFLSIIKNFRRHLKDQIEIFFMQVLITFLESENFPFIFKDAILDILLKLADDCSFLVEIYVNFDCDVNCTAIFSELINLLTKIMNGLYKKSKYQNAILKNQEPLLTNKTFEFLNRFVYNLSVLVERNQKNLIEKEKNKLDNDVSNAELISSTINNINNSNANSNSNNNNINSTNDNIHNNNTINNLTSNNLNSNNVLSEIYLGKKISSQRDQSTDDKSSLDTTNRNVTDKIAKNLEIKKLLEKAIEIFNIGKSTSECLKFLKNKRMIFDENAFNTIKTSYLNDSNNDNIKSVEEYQRLLKPEEHTIISELSEEDLSILDTSKNINIMQTPFISNINPLIYYISNEDKNVLSDLTIDDYNAFEMARFIRTNLKDLIRDRVGDYLCSGKPFNIKVLTYFINSFNFTGMNILQALRLLFMELPLAGEAQVIDRVVQKFGEKFHNQNPTELGNPDFCYYLSFSILQLNTDLHREEVDKKMTLKEFIDQLNLSTGGEKINEKYLENLYNTIMVDPLVIPGQKLSTGLKNREKLLQKEREIIMQSSVSKLETNYTIINNYITDIWNDNIRHLLDFSWSNFLSIYSQLLAESENDKIISSCIENICCTARACGILKLFIAEEAYLNCLINMTNLNEGREINQKNVECIKGLLNFLVSGGIYISKGWYPILNIISKLDYFLTTDMEVIIEDMRSRGKLKNLDREITLSLQKKDILTKNINDVTLEVIFSKSNNFTEEGIINFVSSLCRVSKAELTSYHTPRIFSLQKLVEVADFNLFRIQVEWVKIWKLIGEHLIYVISNTNQEKIWTLAIDSLRQTICKLLEKSDLSIYNFQMDFFMPFKIIFEQTEKIQSRGEMIIDYIYYIVGQYSKNIHSGWILIFTILKHALKRKQINLNEKVKNIMDKISENNTIFNIFNIDIFKGYVGCISGMFIETGIKENTIHNLLTVISKIIINFNKQEKNEYKKANPALDKRESVIENNINIKKRLINSKLNNKKNEFIRELLYGFDDIIKVNPVNHLNIIFIVITNKTYLSFFKEPNNFLYSYFIYILPHIVCLVLNKFNADFSILKYQPKTEDSYTKEITDKIEFYQSFNIEDNNERKKIDSLKMYLINNVTSLIEKIENNNDNNFILSSIFNNIDNKYIEETKKSCVIFLKGILEAYSSHEFDLMLKKKNRNISCLQDKNYDIAVDSFINNIKYLFLSKSYNENSSYVSPINLQAFYERLFIIIHELFLINENNDLYCKIMSKLTKIKEDTNNNANNAIKESIIKLSGYTISKINQHNLFILELLANLNIKAINVENIKKLANFCNYYFSFLNTFNQYNKEEDNVKDFNLLNQIFTKILKIDLEGVINNFRLIDNYSLINSLSKIQEIESHILENYKKDKKNKLKSIYNTNILDNIQYLYQIYKKYELQKLADNKIIEVIYSEILYITPAFLKVYKKDELKTIFKYMINFIDSNDQKLRATAKSMMNLFINENYCEFHSQSENDEDNK